MKLKRHFCEALQYPGVFACHFVASSLCLCLLLHVAITEYWARMEVPSLEFVLRFRQELNQKPMLDKISEHHSYQRELEMIKTYYPTGRFNKLASEALTSLLVRKYDREVRRSGCTIDYCCVVCLHN